jgi:hypothetical protein
VKKSRRMRWAVYVTHMGRREIYLGFLWESQKERDHLGGLNVSGKIILKLTLE